MPAKTAAWIGPQTNPLDRRYGREGIPSPGGMVADLYPNEIGPHQFRLLVNGRWRGNGVVPRSGELKNTPTQGLALGLYPWQMHEGAPFRLWMIAHGLTYCPSSLGSNGMQILFYDESLAPPGNPGEVNALTAVSFYAAETEGVDPYEVTLAPYAGHLLIGVDNHLRQLQMNLIMPYGQSALQLGGQNYDEPLKDFAATEALRRIRSFDGAAFLFLRQKAGGANNPADTCKVQIWDGVAALPDDLTSFVTAGDFPTGVMDSSDILYAVMYNGRVYYRPRGASPIAWTFLAATGHNILQDPFTVAPYDGQNAIAAHKGKIWYTDGVEAPSKIYSAVVGTGIVLERTLPAGGICRALVAHPRIGIFYAWHDQAIPANLKVGFYNSITNVWTDTMVDLTAQDATWKVPGVERVRILAIYRNRLVLAFERGKTLVSPSIDQGTAGNWVTGPWKQINPGYDGVIQNAFSGTVMRNAVPL